MTQCPLAISDGKETHHCNCLGKNPSHPQLRDQYPDFFRLARGLEPGTADLAMGGSSQGDTFGKNPISAANLNDANVVTSRYVGFDGEGPDHKVVIDLDMDAALIPSTTPGHHHLMINKTLSWEDYSFLLKALETVGIIEKGYYKASIIRGATVIRTPWTKKEK
jgi:hypothetical protein